MTTQTKHDEAGRTTAILESMEAFQQSLLDSAEISSDHIIDQIDRWRTQLIDATTEEQKRFNEEKESFITYVAHELRTPMTSIRGYGDMLLKGVTGPLTSAQTDFVKTIVRNVERMQILISDLQDITRIETDQLQLESKPTYLTKAVENALETMEDHIEERGQVLKVDVPDNLPPILGSPARLEQVFTELLRNASKYTPEDGQIHVRLWQEDDRIHASVSDNGYGISSEDQAKLFTKFFRSENPAIREKSGTGLGLCVTKTLVERHGGAFEIESQLGEGTQVTLTFPIHPVEEDAD
ncbi:MAG TPA: HAMP domain-containing histidine kinase [Chloroflexi bacterium]|nr:HAMP domain-containing histidine kinase [Chloroflexota bacterium]